MSLRAGLVALPVVLGSASLVGGCASAPSSSGCTEVPFIEPTTATLDHTAPPAQNSVTFTTGIQYAGKNCAAPAVSVQYAWQVSDATDAAITSPGGTATCLAAAPGPITVSSYLMTVNGSGKTILVPSGLPSATLTCK